MARVATPKTKQNKTPYLVLCGVSALWYHRLAAAGLLPLPYGCEIESLDGAASSLASASNADTSWMKISTADLAARDIYVKDEVETYLRKRHPEDPMEALAYAEAFPHTIDFPKPIDLLCADPGHRNWRNGVHVHVYQGKLPDGALLKIGRNVYVTSPEFTLFQMGREVGDVHLLAALITELAGNHAQLPQGLVCCKRYLDEGRVPFEGRRLIGDGYVDCAPCTSVESLDAMLRRYPHLPGVKLIRRALKGSGDGSRSTFETYVDVELQLPRCDGGRGAGKGRLNERITFDDIEKKMAGDRKCAYADLLLTAKNGKRIDVETNGTFGHADRKRMNRDSGRRHALEHAGIEVIDVTWDEFANAETWDAICRRITNHLGKRYAAPSPNISEKQRLVHTDFCNWDCLRTFPPRNWRS
ncbi:MAG: hypothetical protein U0L51_06250 [Olegusella sp.]|nr:hypothetical protein [Olegusella sp.]